MMLGCHARLLTAARFRGMYDRPINTARCIRDIRPSPRETRPSKVVHTRMIADPRHSRVIVINPERGEMLPPSGLGTRQREFSLLEAGIEMFAVASTRIGGGQQFSSNNDIQLAEPRLQLNVDVVSFWRDRRFMDDLVTSEAGIIFFAGSRLEEEICISALQAAERGYEVRLISDLIEARAETDRSLVFGRLGLHGVLATTVRQTLLEWAVCLGDPLLMQRVQQLLSQSV
jgi:hypothetical protein